MATLPLNALALGVPAAVAAGAYINAKFTLSTDWKTIRHEREWLQRLQNRLKETGGTCTLWGMFDRVHPGAELLWFEGKTWTYGQIKLGTLVDSMSTLWLQRFCC